MKYELIDKVKKFERTKGWIKSILANQEESVNRMLGVIKSDVQDKLSTSRIPNLEEWKEVYTNIGWKYLEDRQVCMCPTPYTIKDSPVLNFNNNRERPFHLSSHYGEVVGNYETYSYCRQEARQTQLILENLKDIGFEQDLFDYESIHHDEALCFLLGINPNLSNMLTLGNEKYISIFEYEEDFYDTNINRLLFKSKENQLLKRRFGVPIINTKEFLDWAVDKYIRPVQEKKTHSKTKARNKNIDIVKKSLIEYLPTIDKVTTKHNLSRNQDFHNILQKNGLNAEENEVDAYKVKSNKDTDITLTSLDNYIAEILISNWWNNDPETSEIRKKIRKPIKSKTKK